MFPDVSPICSLGAGSCPLSLEVSGADVLKWPEARGGSARPFYTVSFVYISSLSRITELDNQYLAFSAGPTRDEVS